MFFLVLLCSLPIIFEIYFLKNYFISFSINTGVIWCFFLRGDQDFHFFTWRFHLIAIISNQKVQKAIRNVVIKLYVPNADQVKYLHQQWKCFGNWEACWSGCHARNNAGWKKTTSLSKAEMLFCKGFCYARWPSTSSTSIWLAASSGGWTCLLISISDWSGGKIFWKACLIIFFLLQYGRADSHLGWSMGFLHSISWIWMLFLLAGVQVVDEPWLIKKSLAKSILHTWNQFLEVHNVGWN